MDFLTVPGTLPDHAIREIIRTAEGSGERDAKLALVNATRAHLEEQTSFTLVGCIQAALDNAEMFGDEPDWSELDGVRAAIGAEFEQIMAESGDASQKSIALASAMASQAKAPLPMHRGRWLAKYGIVDQHVAALAAQLASTPAPAEAFAAPAAASDDDYLAELFGETSAPEVPAAPLATSAESAAAPPQMTSEAAPSAAPGGDVRKAWTMFGQALDLDDAALGDRLGVSRATISNWRHGKVKKVGATLQQARHMVAEIDARVAVLREAANIFAQVRD